MSISKQIVKEILYVRDSRETNMFDIHSILSIAYRKELFHFVSYHFLKKPYVNFIVKGEAAE